MAKMGRYSNLFCRSSPRVKKPLVEGLASETLEPGSSWRLATANLISTFCRRHSMIFVDVQGICSNDNDNFVKVASTIGLVRNYARAPRSNRQSVPDR